MRIVTIGVYGFTEETFFQALQDAGVDVLWDIRLRRGVRGATYAFANSQRLQKRLAELGIAYRHVKELAPTHAIRERQYAADKSAKVAKRQRTQLDPAFIQAYREGVLVRFDPQTLPDALPADAQVIALLCVEREPAACHRSLVAAHLHTALGWPVEHLLPPGG